MTVKGEVEELTKVARRGLGEEHLLPDVCSPGGGTQETFKHWSYCVIEAPVSAQIRTTLVLVNNGCVFCRRVLAGGDRSSHVEVAVK